MSAPDSPNSRTPPSLLSDTARGSEANGSRILANLEGRVVPPAEKKPPRSKKPLVVGALFVVALAAVGAWQLQGRYPSHPAGAAQSDATVSAAATTPAQASGASAAQTTAANSASASAPQAATIVADDSASASQGAASAANMASASGAVDDNRLSRALANGAEDTGAPASAATLAAAPAKSAKSANTAASSGKRHETVASRNKHEAASASRHATKPVAVAQTQKSHDTKTGKAHDDSDADLLAALVARTKPSTEAEQEAPAKPAQSKKSSAKQAAAKETSKEAPTKVAASTNAGDARLADRVKECGQKGFFEDQLCRWRVCDGHWGKDPACPTAATTRQP